MKYYNEQPIHIKAMVWMSIFAGLAMVTSAVIGIINANINLL
jgi:hypothetical protein